MVVTVPDYLINTVQQCCSSNSILTMLCELVPLFFVINEIIENLPHFLRGSTQLVSELIFNYNNYTNVLT
jgi:hypothetical protein